MALGNAKVYKRIGYPVSDVCDPRIKQICSRTSEKRLSPWVDGWCGMTEQKIEITAL